MLVDGASARLGGTNVGSEVQNSAVQAEACIAQPAAFQQACGDVLELMLGRSMLEVFLRLCSGGEASGESREAGEAGGAQAAFGRFWVAGRIGNWSVLVFGAKWIISGRQRVRCGRPACITNACLWLDLQLVHRFEDHRGTRIINFKQTYSCIGVHGTRILQHVLPGSRRPVERCEQPDRPVTTRVRGRARTGGDGLTAYAYYRVGPLHRETAWLGVGLRAD